MLPYVKFPNKIEFMKKKIFHREENSKKKLRLLFVYGSRPHIIYYCSSVDFFCIHQTATAANVKNCKSIGLFLSKLLTREKFSCEFVHGN